MAITKDEMLDAISNMSVLEVVELVKAMEEKFGVSAAAPVAVAAPAASQDQPQAEEKDSFDIVMSAFGENKVAVIKAVRAVTDLGLKEAKDAVEGCPTTIKEGAKKEEAETIKAQLEEAGATVELK